MPHPTFPFILILIFGAVVLGVSYYLSSKFGRISHDVEDYFTMNKQLRAKQLGASFLAADMSIATVVLALGVVGYQFGFWAAVWITICWLVGTGLFLLLIRKPPLAAHLKAGSTLHEAIGSAYDQSGGWPVVRLSASAVTIIVFFFTIGVEFFAGYVVFSKLPGGIAPFICAITIALVVVLFTVAGGYRGTTNINIPRLVLVLLSFIILGFIGVRYQIHYLPGQAHLIFGSLHLDVSWMVGIVIALIPAQLAAMDMWQRCVAAGGDFSQIRRGLLGAMPMYAVWLVPPYLGALARLLQLPAFNIEDTKLNYIVLDVLGKVHPVGVWWSYLWQPLLYAGIIATIGCTADSLLNAMTFTGVFDIYLVLKKVDPNTLTHKQKTDLLSTAKLAVAMAGIASLGVLFIGLFEARIYDLVAALFSVQVILFWPVLFIICGRKKLLNWAPKIACCGLAFGMFSALIFLILAITLHQRSLMDYAPLAATVTTGSFYAVLFVRAPKKAAS